MIRSLFAVVLIFTSLSGATFAVEKAAKDAKPDNEVKEATDHKEVKDIAPLAPQTPSDELGEREGLVFHVNAGLDIQRWENTNSDVRLVPAAGFTADYFLGEVFGLFGSLDHANRGASVGGLSATATFVDLSLGVALRYRGNIFSNTSVNFLQIGALFAIPMGNFTGPLSLATLSSKTQVFMGATVLASSVYPIGAGMFLGPTTWIKFGLGNPVSGLSGNAWFTHVGLGAQLTF